MDDNLNSNTTVCSYVSTRKNPKGEYSKCENESTTEWGFCKKHMGTVQSKAAKAKYLESRSVDTKPEASEATDAKDSTDKSSQSQNKIIDKPQNIREEQSSEHELETQDSPEIENEKDVYRKLSKEALDDYNKRLEEKEALLNSKLKELENRTSSRRNNKSNKKNDTTRREKSKVKREIEELHNQTVDKEKRLEALNTRTKHQQQNL